MYNRPCSNLRHAPGWSHIPSRTKVHCTWYLCEPSVYALQVADFGLARNVSHDLEGGKFPIKWTAPEALRHNVGSVVACYQYSHMACRKTLDIPSRGALLVTCMEFAHHLKKMTFWHEKLRMFVRVCTRSCHSVKNTWFGAINIECAL